ncbi:MAG: tRNA lysidine(34) synthetase TilS [Pseudonocardiales bacterium]|nr:tRNA lysidine(34) synthetase TilS [Pseudonocardiales bacterium]
MPAPTALTVVRRAVRASLAHLPDGPVLVACSGGADSLALAAAARAERDGVRAAVVDHGLQDGSAARAARTVEVLAGIDVPATVLAVTVDGPGGVEAAARAARYAALRAARPRPDTPVLLGHTLDDQAETVLLGLGRGSGPRSIAGMRPWDDPWCRPLLDVRRATTRAACAELGLPVWDDPHNDDRRFTRVRLRHEVLPLLEDVLAGGVAAALARTAVQLREDADALDAVADAVVVTPELEVGPLAQLPAAVRRRVLRRWLRGRGVSGMSDAQLRAADALARPGRDRTGVALPGGLDLVRRDGRLDLAPTRRPAAPDAQEAPRRVRR